MSSPFGFVLVFGLMSAQHVGARSSKQGPRNHAMQQARQGAYERGTEIDMSPDLFAEATGEP